MYDPSNPYADPNAQPDQNPLELGNPPDPNTPAGQAQATAAMTPQQKSQLAQMAAAMGRTGYRGNVAPMAVPAAGDDPRSPLMGQAEQEQSAQKGYGASASDITSILAMLA